MSKAGALLGTERPYEVPSHIGQVRLIVTDSAAKAQMAVGAFMHRSPARKGIRIAGGCLGMSREDRIGMLRYFQTAFEGFTGLVSSGATRGVTGRQIDPMVTDVPAVLARHLGRRVLTLSTVPRTGDMSLQDDTRLVLDTNNGVNPQPGVHMIVVFQPPLAHQAMEWDGDLEGYFTLFDACVRSAGWSFGMTVWNGGGITKQEALKAAQLGWPVFLVEGSGRVADELVAAAHGGRLKGKGRFVIVPRSDPGRLRAAMVQYGFSA